MITTETTKQEMWFSAVVESQISLSIKQLGVDLELDISYGQTDLVLSEVVEDLVHPGQHLLLAGSGASPRVLVVTSTSSSSSDGAQVLFFHFDLKQLQVQVNKT